MTNKGQAGMNLCRWVNVCWPVMALLFSSALPAAEYKVGVRAKSGIEQAKIQWQATVDYLTEQIPNHRFILVPMLSLREITAAVGRGDLDFLITNPSSAVEVEHLHGAQILATLKNRRANTAQTRFGSVVFVHAKNEHIMTLNDLKGKTLMAVSEPAFGGWRVVWRELLLQGIDPYRDLKSVKFANSIQENVVYAVRDGKADAGVVRTDQLERMEAAGKIDMRYFRILNNKNVSGFPFFLSTDLYPEWPFLSMKGVPINVTQLVGQSLLSVTADSEAAKKGKYVGWVAPLNYNSVEELMKTLKVGPFALPEK